MHFVTVGLRFILAFSFTALARADYFLKDGDKVAFLGDSITAARGYPKIVEHYTLMRFPGRRVEFVNAGQGGDTSSGSLARLERDVFSNQPTVVIVAFGINDIGWGTKADDEHKKLYLDGIRTIISKCVARKIRPVVCSASITAEAADKAEKGYLQAMCDEGLALAKSMGAQTIDLQRGMREIQRRVDLTNASKKDPAKQDRLHVADGIHLSELGQLALAYVMLKGLGAPEEVSSTVIDAKSGAAIKSDGCKISAIKTLSDGIAFTRVDEGLPLNLGPLSGLQYGWVPVPDGINGYRLTIQHLADGDYTIRCGGRDLGKTTAAALAKGLNISAMTADGWQPGGPWDAQSNVVKSLVDARDQLWMAGKQQKEFLPEDPGQGALLESISKMDHELVALQRNAARPYPYPFEIRRVVPKP
ncbi:MAG: SGNH/GDSL hydrolase family protein [Verrucomicrobiota bacterium]